MTAGFIPSLREYNRVFGVTTERLSKAPKNLVIMHPGPMNRGVEIDSDVADGPHSVILPQVTNGVAVRMAVLYLLAGGSPDWQHSGGAGVIRPILIQGGRVIDPSRGTDGVADVYLTDGKVAAVGSNIVGEDGALVIPAAGKVVAPG